MEFLATKTDSEHVREFTGEAGQPIPEKPSAMTQTETKFISKMILDEVVSFLFFSLRFLIRSLSHSSHSSHSLSHSSLSLSLSKKNKKNKHRWSSWQHTGDLRSLNLF